MGRPFKKIEPITPDGGSEIVTGSIPTITPEPEIPKTNKIILVADEVRSMGVIKIHTLIREKYPQPEFQNLLDVYNREDLQNKFIEALGK